MDFLKKDFESQEELIDYVKQLAPWAKGKASSIKGGRGVAENAMTRMQPVLYAQTRNYGDGNVTRLSPYIRHGILGLNEVRNYALRMCKEPIEITKFIQELAWRDFWHKILILHPEFAWQDCEPYKTGYQASDYSDDLPHDILEGKTGIACLDNFILELINTGYIHNHARMYLASYIVHFRRIKWQAGARWFLHHLLDGDLASNNLSWQWVASTFSNKPYIFNLENVAKYFSDLVNICPFNNDVLNDSYESLTKRLFPNLKVL